MKHSYVLFVLSMILHKLKYLVIYDVIWLILDLIMRVWNKFHVQLV